VLVTCARPGQLAVSLERISAFSGPLELLVVVDNQPTEANERLVQAFDGPDLPIRYLAAPENLGPAGARNLGAAQLIRRAGPEDWVAFFDDDEHVPHPRTLDGLLAFARSLAGQDVGGVALAGARIDWRRARTVSVDADQNPVEVQSLHGWAFPMYRVGPFRDVGGFDGSLFFGLEELELGLRILGTGHRLLVHSSLAARVGLRPEDPDGARPRLLVESPRWQRYYSLRNLLVLLRRHGRWGRMLQVALTRGLAKPLANLPLRPVTALRHLRLNGRAVRDGVLSRLGRRLEPDVSGEDWDRPGRASRRFPPTPGVTMHVEPDRATPKELVERFLSGMIDARILVRRLTEAGISPRGAADHARILAPRVTRPTPRWGVGQWVDGGDLYAENDPPESGLRAPEEREGS
jgi:GT2 family glycosyltransferase